MHRIAHLIVTLGCLLLAPLLICAFYLVPALLQDPDRSDPSV